MDDNNQSPPPQVKSSNFEKPFYLKYKLPVQIISWAITVLLVLWGYNSFFAGKQGTACTLEAKICPDGTGVGRVPPNCEFAPCPSASPQGKPTDETANWKTYINSGEGFSFNYPPDWNLTDESSVTNGVAPQLSKTIVQGDKPALISILKFKSAEYGSEDLRNFSPFTYREFEINQNTYVLIAYTYQVGSSATKQTEEAAIEVLDKIAFTFKFTDQTEGVVCAQDVKQCPDGSFVGREPPSCEFAPCPK